MNELVLDIRIAVQQSNYLGGRIEIAEQVNLPAVRFLEMSKILAQFHDLAMAIQEKARPQKR